METLGFTLTRDTPPQLVDRMLEKAVEAAHRDGERLHWVTLGVLALQTKTIWPPTSRYLGCSAWLETTSTFSVPSSNHTVLFRWYYFGHAG